jgi:hypothetical protein
MIGSGGGTSFTEVVPSGVWTVILGAPPNRLLTRVPVRCSMERAPSEFRFGGRLSRKSVRQALSSEGMGSEIPISVPVDVRFVFWATRTDAGRCLALYCRMQRARRRASAAPQTAPGKKPATTAPVGNEGHEEERLVVESATATLEVDTRG